MKTLEINLGKPNPKQRKFLKAKTRYVGYGGARGGGKSWSIRAKAIALAYKHAGIKILIIRRTYQELQSNHIDPLRSILYGAVTYSEKNKLMVFPNGSTIKFGYLKSDSDVLQYQGIEYDVVFIDEATHFTEHHFTIFKACVRGVNKFPKRIYVTCNPGGVGHEWVKRLFVDRRFKPEENPDDYSFIQATVYDNEVLMKVDPEYEHQLKELPENLREAWLYGNWDMFVGQYFTMWDEKIHVSHPFIIPRHWRRYVTMDYGRDMFACYFIAVDEKGKAYVYKEIYQNNLIVSEAIETLKVAMGNDRIEMFMAPPDLWNTQSMTGKSTAEAFAEAGIPLYKASNDRINGWYDLSEWLKVKDGDTNLTIFNYCHNLIRCLPLLQFDEKNPNDIAKEPHEYTHGPDALRYWCAGRPVPTREHEDRKLFEWGVKKFDGGVSDFLGFGR